MKDSIIHILQTRFLLVLSFVLCVSMTYAQKSQHSWEALLNDVMALEDGESLSWQETYDILCELEQHPIDLNNATREDLEAIPFLTAQQVMDICEYLYKYRLLFYKLLFPWKIDRLQLLDADKRCYSLICNSTNCCYSDLFFEIYTYFRLSDSANPNNNWYYLFCICI